MAKITRLPAGVKEMGGKLYDIVSPCSRCANIRSHPDGLGHCAYRMHGFDPEQVIICGNKVTDLQKRK